MEPIRILFIQGQLNCGGTEQALFDLVSLLDQTKFDVSILVQKDGGEWEGKFSNSGFPVSSPWSNQVNSSNFFTKLRNFYKRSMVRYSLKRNGKNLIPLIFQQKFDIVVSYSTWRLHEIGFLKGSKSVKYIHGDVSTNEPFKASILDSLSYIRRFDKIICVSKQSQESFQQLTGRTDNVSTHYNPLNSNNVRSLACSSVNIPDDLPFVCAVGRLAPEKGYNRLIIIHKQLLQEGIKHRLVIVGDGPEHSKLENTIKTLQVEDTVLLTGYSSNPYPYMKQSKFIVCSSFTEGLPVIAMEALCLGIPVVSSVPSIAEIFGNDECGIITPNDDNSLKNGICRMLTDNSYYSHIKAGAEMRSTFFDGKRMVKEIENEFIDLAGR